MIKIPSLWANLLLTAGKPEILDAIAEIESILDGLSKQAVILPTADHRYRALSIDPEKVRCVIVGQDPYHGIAEICLESGETHSVPEAMGLSFSVPKGIKIPPSLRNIFKELNQDVGYPAPDHGDLTAWADRGVLLLNRMLSVQKDKPGSHSKLGWQQVTEALVSALSQQHSGIVFILWGNHAKSVRPFIANNEHTIIESSHPSPIGGSCNKGFFGSRPFSRANEALANLGKQTIDWSLS
ncbi:MAG: uracil-DNA glycosylase [Methylobacter sp.]|jgi:uracil-DNA glycosylase|uniref:uracil-DNA glycosylase n=1 Tax=Methylicorpusculum TaxID=2713642 RepID=UPI000D2BC3A1|nr:MULTISPECIES: uracil-DNA glycosylase [Methylicorpusculum]MBS3951932.1 uracil-DNA glycosylase [Methylomicrobium sp.]MCD2452015.1 uracil-DNA glycosylase [Methylicorpusculum oleiharenae]MDP2203521.1 uracil-DNA glycosylase [Methylicorpusculum sp.]PPC92275.1 MAG: uracil-DNA glycosylase [Methylobacter sp.]